jgi:hypothetical protein
MDKSHLEIIDNLIILVETMSSKKNKLPQKLLEQIISNPSICNLSLTYELIKHVCQYLLSNYGLAIDAIDFYKDTISNMETQYPCMYMYYRFIKYYKNINFEIFSLGSSLEKFNILWNSFNIDNIIKEIPLSGSMYDYGENHTIVLNERKRDEMVHKFPLLLRNNPAFRKLVDTLNKNRNDVLITDVKGSGKSLKTILYLLNLYKVNVSRLFFLYITTNYDGTDGLITNEISEDLKQYNYYNPIIYFNNTNLDTYFVKGEEAGARCIAHYQKEVWDEPPTPIYYDNPANPEAIIDNYRKCNFHTLLFIMFSACFFKKYIMPKLKRVDLIYPEGQNIDYINRDIKEFIYSNLSEETKLEISLRKEEEARRQAERDRLYKLRLQEHNELEAKKRMYDTPDNKYLKYKLKYIKLKEKLKKI